METGSSQRKKNSPYSVEGFAEDFAELNRLLKKFENVDPPNTKRFSLTEKNVYGALSVLKNKVQLSKFEDLIMDFIRPLPMRQHPDQQLEGRELPGGAGSGRFLQVLRG